MARLKLPRLPRRKAKERLEPVLAAGGASGGPPPGHPTVAAADPYSFRVAHRRLAWMLRLSAASNVALVCAVVVQANAIGVMLPLKETRFALVRTFGADDKLYRVEPLSEEVEGFDVQLEAMARQYVQNVVEIDPVTETERREEARRMSDKSFWKGFERERVDTEERRKALQDGLIRLVRIENTDKIQSFSEEHKVVVDFVQIDERRGQEVGRRQLRAYLSMTTRPQSVSPEDLYLNPLGITVLHFVLKERD